MPCPATPAGSRLASSTVAGSPGQPGATGSYPAPANFSIHGPHELACSHNPCTKTTGFAMLGSFRAGLPVLPGASPGYPP